MIPVQYLTKCEDPDLAGFTVPGFYFWNEEWTNCYGPYDSYERARAAYDDHVHYLEEQLIEDDDLEDDLA
jgi:hypothetical protein